MRRPGLDKRTSKLILLHVATLAVLLILPFFLKSYYQKLAVEAIILSVFAMSLDLVMGYAGIATFGHAAFFGIGGYALGVMIKFVIPSVWISLLAAGLASALLALFIGSVSIRTKGIYFAILTLAFAEVVYRIIFHSYNTPLGGSDGLVGIPTPNLSFGFFDIDLRKVTNFYYVALAFAYLSYLTCKKIVESPFGSVLRGIRENEKRIPFLGFSVRRHKIAAFVIAGAFAGLSGAMFSLFKTYADTEQLGFLLSGKVIVMDLIGGVGTLIGPMVGAVFITIFESIISTHFAAHNIIIGAIFVIVVIFMPKGFLGLFSKEKEDGDDDRQ
jgi:branched-chain amino acid transport system permease protein